MSEQPNTTISAPEPAAEPSFAQDGLNVATLVLGVGGASLGMAGAAFWMALPLGVPALVLGVIGHRRAQAARRRSRMSLAGIGMGCTAIVLGLVQLVLSMAAPGAAHSAPITETGDANGQVLEVGEPAMFGRGLEVSVTAITRTESTVTEGSRIEATVRLRNTGQERLFTDQAVLELVEVDGVPPEHEVTEISGGEELALPVAPGSTVTSKYVWELAGTGANSALVLFRENVDELTGVHWHATLS